jgi:hypothetical protein
MSLAFARPDWRAISRSDRPVPSAYARIHAKAVLDFRAALDAIWEAEARLHRRPISKNVRSASLYR